MNQVCFLCRLNKNDYGMLLKSIFCVLFILLFAFAIIVIKMSITDVKEEINDMDKASSKKKKNKK